MNYEIYGDCQIAISYGEKKYDFYIGTMSVYLADIINDLNKIGYNNIKASNELLRCAYHFRGRQVLGNIQIPQKASLSGLCILSTYDYPDIKNCQSRWEFDSMEDIIELVTNLVELFNGKRIAYNCYISKMTYYDMKYICNSPQIAINTINYFKGLLSTNDLFQGVREYNKLTPDNRRFLIDMETQTIRLNA